MLEHLRLLLLLHLDLELFEPLGLCLILDSFLAGLQVGLMVYTYQLILVLVDVVCLGHSVLDDCIPKVGLLLDLPFLFLNALEEVIVVLLLLVQDLIGSSAGGLDLGQEFGLLLLQHFDAVF